MTAAPNATGESPRSEARRAQILAAARDCFRRNGFHGASIAQICREAGMSAGHIYHYFENKEAIIAAIVEQDLDRLLTMTAELRAAPDILSAIAACTADGVRDNLEAEEAALKVEIVAEAARNPRVAEIVRAADLRCRASVIETLREHRRILGLDEDETWLDAMAELFATMYDGLLIRAVRNPDIDKDKLISLFRNVILGVITSPKAASGSY
ncbi:TetR/AcrR family transcriptional regulator [Thauera sp. CAU 1555]|uniref:TetR/AcrR family transcriptional regulator n=1 Tax=Thauera sedimentorum TaxID=2767595 RepID=A0ABR9BC00_9RHOO|nr:TetR/AcrR family transcriptional regulator [Thauera sedimentorum]MBC9072959.1 TetR/AcrR family transcriptional regulator [Thauera sedimentorum]MBD8503878.1 TetR/AcrR family transcriptional regulator [Thauera sedimentorum]